MLPRLALPRLHRLVSLFPVVVVAGARQAGKTTLLREALGPEWTTLTLDPAVDVAGARRDPDLLLANHPGPLCVDEAQYAPELVAAIKRAVDRDRRPGRFVLSGSQQWSGPRSLAESLAGRAVFLDLNGFTLQEREGKGVGETWVARWLAAPEPTTLHGLDRLRGSRTLNERLFRGVLPEANVLPLDVLPDFFAGYRRTFIERDVRLLGEVSDAQLFGRFMGLAGALSAQEVNTAELGRELGISPQTAKRWLALLHGSLQWFEIPAFSRNVVKRATGRTRGFVTDTGLACATQLVSSPATLDTWPRRGALFETAVVSDIRAQCQLLSPTPNLWHWRLHSGAEVDLLLEWNGTLYPIEIKLKSHPDKQDARGMRTFRATFPKERIAPGLIVAPVEAVEAITADSYAIPWDAVGP